MSSHEPEDPTAPGTSGRERDEGTESPERVEPVDRPDTDEWWVDRFILYMARESMLWLLLFVIVAHISAFIASAGLTAARTLHPFAIAISLVLVGFSVWGVVAEVERKGKLAGLTWLLLATWLLGGVLAYLGNRYDFL